jgi:hypothetical protein
MITRCRRWRALLALAVMQLIATTRASAADYELTLTRGFLERIVEDAVTATVLTADDSVYWGHVSGPRVEISRQSAQQIAIDLDLAYALDNFSDPEVDVNIVVGFSCFYAQPDVNLSVPDLDVSVSFPWYIDVATLGFAWVGAHVANVVIDNKISSMEQVKQQVVAEINAQLGAASFEFCPEFSVTPDANVKVSFGYGDECAFGETRHLPCTGNTHGSGTHQTCINGYWEGQRDCEPNAPPGGHPL